MHRLQFQSTSYKIGQDSLQTLTGTETRLHIATTTVGHKTGPGSTPKVCKAKNHTCGRCGKKGHLDSLCRSAGIPLHMLEAQDYTSPQSQETPQDYHQSLVTAQYSTPYFVSKEELPQTTCNSLKTYGDQEVKVIGLIILYMYTTEKTDRVIWQVTKTTGVPILGRTQTKLMNYISYPEIRAPKDQQQSPVSMNSLKSTDYIYTVQKLGIAVYSLERLCSLCTVSRLHPQLTRLPKKSTELQPEHNQPQHMDLSLHKSPGTRVQSQ